MVFDVPAESGGALTILKQYYEKALVDENNEWVFVVSVAQLENQKNIKVLKYPWVKKSWFHRLFFDNVTARKIFKKYEAEKVISLQNITIKGANAPQSLYVHQALPFSEIRFNLFQNYIFWIYQNIIGNKIKKSIKRADKVIVQTKWMKDACIKACNIAANKIEIESPLLAINVKRHYVKNDQNITEFFYPAIGAEYKNHKVIIDACKILKEKNINNYRIIFTIVGNENKYVKKLFKNCNKQALPIDFIGPISREQVFDYYSKSILLFPSYIETFGLPLREAKLHNTPIISSNCAYALEVLDKYPHAKFFNPFKSNELSNLMMKLIENNKI